MRRRRSFARKRRIASASSISTKACGSRRASCATLRPRLTRRLKSLFCDMLTALCSRRARCDRKRASRKSPTSKGSFDVARSRRPGRKRSRRPRQRGARAPSHGPSQLPRLPLRSCPARADRAYSYARATNGVLVQRAAVAGLRDRGRRHGSVRAALVAHAAANPAKPDIAFPREYRGVHLQRRRECGFQLYESVGIARGDRDASARQTLENFRLFGAPHVAIVTTDEALEIYGAIDCGASSPISCLQRKASAWRRSLKRRWPGIRRSSANLSLCRLIVKSYAESLSATKTRIIRQISFAQVVRRFRKPSLGSRPEPCAARGADSFALEKGGRALYDGLPQAKRVGEECVGWHGAWLPGRFSGSIVLTLGVN